MYTNLTNDTLDTEESCAKQPSSKDRQSLTKGLDPKLIKAKARLEVSKKSSVLPVSALPQKGQTMQNTQTLGEADTGSAWLIGILIITVAIGARVSRQGAVSRPDAHLHGQSGGIWHAFLPSNLLVLHDHQHFGCSQPWQ